VDDYQAGQSTTQFMQIYRLGKGTVLDLLADQGVKMRGQGLPDDQLAEAVRL